MWVGVGVCVCLRGAGRIPTRERLVAVCYDRDCSAAHVLFLFGHCAVPGTKSMPTLGVHICSPQLTLRLVQLLLLAYPQGIAEEDGPNRGRRYTPVRAADDQEGKCLPADAIRFLRRAEASEFETHKRRSEERNQGGGR